MLDWDDLRFFLAVARAGSLTEAGKALGVAQSTVGRRLFALETGLGARLFNRTPSGYVLTPAGTSVMASATRMEAEGRAVERRVGGCDVRFEGAVGVACSEFLSAHLLAPCLAELHGRYPAIEFELVPEYREVSLAMREADVAVRLQPSHQHDLVVRTVGRLAFGLYASRDYVARNGLPDPAGGCGGHRALHLIGSECGVHAGWFRQMAAAAEPGVRVHTHESLFCAARAGGGVACLLRYRADSEPELQRLATPVPPPASDISLAVHKDNRHTPRIRITLDTIAEAIKAAADRLNPPDAGASG